MIATDIQLQYTADNVPQLLVTLTKKENLLVRSYVGKYREKREKFPTKWYELTLSEWHDKRTSGANSYMWVLCDKIAEKLQIQQSEAYRAHIREYGVFQDVTLPIEASKFLRESWRAKGIGWFAEYIDQEPDESGNVALRLYYGSSSYNSKEMARLIDGVVGTAHDLEIETKTPQQIADMISLIKEGRGE